MLSLHFFSQLVDLHCANLMHTECFTTYLALYLNGLIRVSIFVLQKIHNQQKDAKVFWLNKLLTDTGNHSDTHDMGCPDITH